MKISDCSKAFQCLGVLVALSFFANYLRREKQKECLSTKSPPLFFGVSLKINKCK